MQWSIYDWSSGIIGKSVARRGIKGSWRYSLWRKNEIYMDQGEPSRKFVQDKSWDYTETKGKKKSKWMVTCCQGPCALTELALLGYKVLLCCNCKKVTAMCYKMLQVQAGENCV